MKLKYIFSIFFLMMIAFSGNMFAQGSGLYVDFEIPVRLTNLHQNVESVWIYCNVYPYGDGTAHGYGEVTLTPDKDGNINETVKIRAAEVEGKDITQGDRWAVHFQLKTAEGTFWANYNPDPPNVALQAKEGEPLNKNADGSLNWNP